MKRAHVVTVRQVNDEDQARQDRFEQPRHDPSHWCAIDSNGHQFFDDTEQLAREACETYNRPRRAPRHHQGESA